MGNTADAHRHETFVQSSVELIRSRVEEHADAWFSGRGTPRTVDVRILSDRPRCLLLTARLDGAAEPAVLAKVRRDGADLVRASPRPRLRSDAVTAAQLTTLEYAGLRTIADVFGAAQTSFGVVRPLDHREGETTLLMGFVHAPTLRQALLDSSRLSRHRRSVAPIDPLGACRLAGEWLRTFQDMAPVGTAPSRQARRDDVVQQFHAYDVFLRPLVGDRALGRLAERGAELAGAVLPEKLPLSLGHGDFAPRNMFVDHDRLAVFDPMPRWSVPVYEDLCRFLVGVRLLGIQVHSHGRAFPAGTIDSWQEAAIQGYLGEDRSEPAQLAAVRCYEVLLMLDKWSALVDAQGTGWRSQIEQTSLRLAAGYVRGQVTEVLQAAERAAR